MRETIKSLIHTIEPEFHSESSFSSRPLPSELTLYLENVLYFIDISFSSEGTLHLGIWNGDDEYVPDEEMLAYIYDYCDTLMEVEIEATKCAYESERYENNSHNYYIR
tara:strand:- start:119 stop:442 length:324 start_codon:yes stop_codon:yes gene_type:complete